MPAGPSRPETDGLLQGQALPSALISPQEPAQQQVSLPRPGPGRSFFHGLSPQIGKFQCPVRTGSLSHTGFWSVSTPIYQGCDGGRRCPDTAGAGSAQSRAAWAGDAPRTDTMADTPARPQDA